MAIIIQILNNQGNVTSNQKLDQSRVTIGRSYDNDIILNDPHICPQHAALYYNDQAQWYIEDLNSINGIFNHLGKPFELAPIPQDGLIFTLGKQKLRALSSNAPVAPTLILPKKPHILSSIFLLAILILFILLELAYDTWINTLGENAKDWKKELLMHPFYLLMFIIWPAFFSLIARLRSLDTQFLNQSIVFFTALSVWIIWLKLYSLLSFNFSTSSLLPMFNNVIPGIILLILLWYNIKLCGVTNKWLHIFLTLMLTSTYWLIPYANNDNKSLQPSFSAKIFSENLLITKPTTINQFLIDGEVLFSSE